MTQGASLVLSGALYSQEKSWIWAFMRTHSLSRPRPALPRQLRQEDFVSQRWRGAHSRLAWVNSLPQSLGASGRCWGQQVSSEPGCQLEKGAGERRERPGGLAQCSGSRNAP